MRVGLIAPPFISVPPAEYGGTELFIAHLAVELKALGVDLIVYTNGESTVGADKRFLFEKAQWPLKKGDYSELKDLDHTTWSLADASGHCDLIHLNTVTAVGCSRLVRLPIVYTLHHATIPQVSAFYSHFPEVEYVCISDDQRSRESMPKMRTIHHGIDLRQYKFQERKQPYLSFIGRIAPIKGTHLAIEIAKKAVIPLKIAGEIQPQFRDYFEAKIRPHIDGEFIEYVGPADFAAKNELLGNSMAMLFPIEWDEPFGLVMVEAMACGTPVLALRHGSVREIVREGVSGHVARRVNDLVKRAKNLQFSPHEIRQYAEDNFSAARMARDYLAAYRAVARDAKVGAA